MFTITAAFSGALAEQAALITKVEEDLSDLRNYVDEKIENFHKTINESIETSHEAIDERIESAVAKLLNETQKECEGTLPKFGVLTSPNYPDNYDNGIDGCVFIISRPNGTAINLRVDDFRLEGGEFCPYDYVEIRDGSLDNSPLIGKFCGSNSTNSPPNDILSSQNHLWIR